MRKIALIALAVAGLAASTGASVAQVGIYVSPRGDGYYGPRYYRERPDPYAYEYGRGERRIYAPRRGGRCPPNYTVQDGVCKPYRGY